MTRFAVYVLLSTHLFLGVLSNTNYCDICNDHIACNNNGEKAADCASDAALVNITPELKNLLLDAHNSKRNSVAGGNVENHSPACRMATMQWNDELSSLAALNVKQCVMKHDSCHNTVAFKYSGQNLAYIGFWNEPNYQTLSTRAVDLWFGEYKDSNMKYIQKFPSDNSILFKIGHFTVMVADRNTHVGCAALTYSKPNSYKVFLIACNYATTNIVDFPIYGDCPTAGTGCVTGTNPSYPNLCSLSEQYNVNKFY
ncbi:antigen 5 like allergen Cul n 1-like [Teleopsis dalmanni]|nr:antigen 5 like allergen Cul n 1-like [Teleopsis dalmanni]